MTATFLDWALAYADRGWPVLPLHTPTSYGPKTGPDKASCSCGKRMCESQGKHPRLAHGLTDASVSPGTIRLWWRRWPDAGIGLRTGDRFDVVDVDGGAEALDRLDAAAPKVAGVITGPLVLTGNGLHLYVEPTGCGNRAGLVDGIDWRGDGGYVVAPPSVHPSGHRYMFDPDHGIDAPLATVEPWLLNLVRRPQRPPGRPPDPGRGGGSAYGRRALESELGRLALAAEGRRNDELVRAAFRLGSLVAGGELDARDVAGSLLTVALRIGLTEDESVRTIHSGMSSGMSAPRTAPEARR